MYTNEFGQTVQADDVLINVEKDVLENLFLTVYRSVSEGSLYMSIESYADSNTAYIVTSDVDIDVENKLLDAGLDINEGEAMFRRTLQLIFGESASVNDIHETVFSIRMDFNEYIQRVHGI